MKLTLSVTEQKISENGFCLARHGLLATSLVEKTAAISAMQLLLDKPQAWHTTRLPEIITTPGFPESLVLVPPQQVKQRKLSTVAGRAVLLHAIAHIEFNAINLALDMLYRFRNMPLAFYIDWLQVAAEEAKHHQLLQDRCTAWGMRMVIFPRIMDCGKLLPVMPMICYYALFMCPSCLRREAST